MSNAVNKVKSDIFNKPSVLFDFKTPDFYKN